MKQIGSIAAIALLLGGAALAQAAPVPTGVALINFQRAVSQNDEGVKAGGTYTAEGKKLADDLLKSQSKVTELQDKYAKSNATMSDSDKLALQREIDKEKKLYDVNQQNAQSTLDDRQNELFRPIAERVHKVVEAYAAEQNLVIVLNAPDDSLLWANDVVDITTEIIRRVNADIVKNPSKTK